jgi:hypothetical protein
MSKEFKITFAANASTDEIVDSIADVFGIAYIIENALSDGFQLTDILTAIQLEPKVKEVINDFPVFIAQFQTLSGSTALQAVEAAKARSIGEFGDLGKIGGFAYGLLIQAATTFNFVESTVVAGIGQLNQWKALFDTIKKEPEA